MWFIRDGCGIACAIVTWFLVLYAEFVVLFVMLIPSRDYVYSIINGIVFNLLAFLALASHCRAMLTDPGAVPKGNATKEFIESLQLKPGQVVYKCPKCCSIKPDRAHHCSVCKRHSEDGSPLSVGQQLCRREQPEVLRPVYNVHSPHFLARPHHGGIPLPALL